MPSKVRLTNWCLETKLRKHFGLCLTLSLRVAPFVYFALNLPTSPFTNHLVYKLLGTVLPSTTAFRLLHKAPGLLYFNLLVIKLNKLFQWLPNT